MRFPTLDTWLQWQSELHPHEIELGLERVAQVWRRLHPEPPTAKVVTVAGTNGKGSSAALLEAILLAAGYRTGCYTSPHLARYNERIRIAGEEVSDDAICRAFERIDRARGGTSLTYFEFGTLAALLLFCAEPLDVLILEVGLGGRLDAVNIIDPDVALITSIGLDHTQWLGASLEQIATEKAGVMRPGRPVVFSGQDAAETLQQSAEAIGARLFQASRDFAHRGNEHGWEWQGPESFRRALPLPNLRGAYQLANAAGVLMVLNLLEATIPVDQGAIRQGLQQCTLRGRFQVLPGKPTIILDVAHNAQAAGVLAANLRQMYAPGRTLAVIGMLADKDVEAVTRRLTDQVDHWYLTALPTSRGMPVELLAERVAATGLERQRMEVFDRPAQALAAARDAAGEDDRVLVCGSFYLVGEILSLI